MALFAEIRRRNVLKVAVLYIIAGWLILWFVLNTGTVLGLPTWADTAAAIILLLGFPVALLFAWTYERTESSLAAGLQHALFGCWLFTAGLGWFFYLGSVGG